MPPAGQRHAPGFTSYIVIAAAVIAARLPFLIRAARFFDSDEAVEGLMARHVFAGEFPLYVWGQHYKGVPEVYLNAAALRIWPGDAIAGPGNVTALKLVTLLCFALYACLNFRLLSELFSRRVAWLATAALVAAPPSLVLWSLSGSAEIVMTFLAGTTLLLGLSAWLRHGSRAGLVVAGAAFGFGLWVQQYILFYAAAAAIAAAMWEPQSIKRTLDFASGPARFWWLRLTVRILFVAASLYFLLGLVAFTGLEFSFPIAGAIIIISHAQKMWWIAAALTGIAVAILTAAHILTTEGRPLLPGALGFLLGFSPAILGRLFEPGSGAPMPHMDAASLAAVVPSLTTMAVPIVLGLRSTTTEMLTAPAWSGLLLAAIVVASYARMTRVGRNDTQPLTSVFHVFLLLAPVVFALSGAYIDAQSYRYLMPMHAALPAVYAVGIDGVWRASRGAGVALAAALVVLFAVQQVDWYSRLAPDREAQRIIGCLAEENVRSAYGDYWLAYKITFLTGERVIVSPTTGVDRYPPFTDAVKQAPSPTIERLPRGNPDAPCSSLVRFHNQ
jgi:hypothetical protein